jgi:hypothetical protein
MTKLDKEVRRLTHTLHRGRQVIVAMRPPDMLTFRLKGTRHVYPLSIIGAFNMAMKVEAIALFKKQKDAREAKRKARRQQYG